MTWVNCHSYYIVTIKHWTHLDEIIFYYVSPEKSAIFTRKY